MRNTKPCVAACVSSDARFFNRYLLPTELLVNRLRGGTAMHGGQDVLKVELKRLEWETKRNEVIHLLALLLVTPGPHAYRKSILGGYERNFLFRAFQTSK
jgi:hypothetical protein